MTTRNEIMMAGAHVVVRRLERSPSMSKTFIARAAEAAEQALKGKMPRPAEVEEIAELIATRALLAIFGSIKPPSKGALRDAADVAGRECVQEVIRD